MNKIEYEGLGTIARIETPQGAYQKVKWFLKVHKTYNLLRRGYF